MQWATNLSFHGIQKTVLPAGFVQSLVQKRQSKYTNNRIDRRTNMEKLFMKGNEAVAEAAVRAGCRFFSGYPITPQNEIPEYMAKRLPEVGGVFVQGESEIASISMVYGAAAMGTLALTSSSSPGISLKAEGISTLAGAELPAVIINVMRGGPGLGAIQSAQGDYLQVAKASGHGGFRMLVYAPSTAQEAVDMTYKAFGKAVEYMNPVLIASDGIIGAMMEGVVLPEARTVERLDFKTMASTRYNPGRRVICSCLNEPENQEKLNIKAAEMYDGWQNTECMVEEYLVEDAEIIIAAYGSAARIAKTAIDELRAQGTKVGLIRPITLYPFAYDAFRKLDYSRVKHVIDIEMSIPAQMIDDVRLGVLDKVPVTSAGRSGGIFLTSEDVIEAIQRI
jgi:2-oxoglutarate/2-oxoacid ferredoxin oxidoreductase subunit alpha